MTKSDPFDLIKLNYQFYDHSLIYTKSSVLFSLIYTSGITKSMRLSQSYKRLNRESYARYYNTRQN